MSDWPKLTRVMTDEAAYKAYEAYAIVHKATTADPLRTFSGWLKQMHIKIAGEQSK